MINTKLNPLKEISFEEAKNKLLRSLSSRDLTTTQAKRKLVQWGLKKESISLLIKEFEASNWLNDLRFTDRFIENRLKRGYGWNRIENELRQRGISSETCKIARNKMIQDDNSDEQDTLNQLAEREWNKLSQVPREKRVNRFVARMLRRGFSHHQVLTVLRSLEKRENRQNDRNTIQEE